MTEEQQNIEENISPQWFIDEGLPGIGEKPKWLNDKFKSVADLAKSYAELEKKFGQPPEEYDFSKSKYLDPDYVPFQELRSIAKEKRVPKDVVDKMIDSFDKYMDEFSVDYSNEIKSLGDNATERVKVLDNWAQSNLSKDAYEALVGSLKSANSIKALEEIRGKMMNSNNVHVPSGNQNSDNGAMSVDDIKAEMVQNLDKYKTDADYRKQITQRLELAVKNTPGFVDKIGG